MDKFPSRERATTVVLEPRVSAIVVARQVPAHGLRGTPLDLCLRSALAEPSIDDVVIVDQGNAPEISSALRALQADRRDVKVAPAAPTLSAAAAANIGARHARGRWLLFLDPDVVLRRGSVSRLVAAGGGAHAPWVVGGRLTDLKGRDRHASHVRELNTFSALALALSWPRLSPPRRRRRGAPVAAQPVAAVSSAFMLLPRNDFEALGGFDEGFATDCADLDLCRRATAAGGSVLFLPDAAGVHLQRAPKTGRRQAQGLARLASKSARTPLDRAAAAVAGPALGALLWLKDLVLGRPPRRR